jgi:hypothetical protein
MMVVCHLKIAGSVDPEFVLQFQEIQETVRELQEERRKEAQKNASNSKSGV